MMLKNNNHSVVFQLAKNSLKAGKRRNVPIVLIIAIATVVMASLTLIVWGIHNTNIRNLKGSYQVSFSELSDAQIEQLKQCPQTDGVGLFWRLGIGQTKEFTLFFSAMDEEMLRLGKMEIAGSAPQKADDIVLDKQFSDKFMNSADIGDRISLTVNGREQEFSVTGFTSTNKSASAAEEGQTSFNAIVSPAFVGIYAPETINNRAVYLRINDAENIEPRTLKESIYEIADTGKALASKGLVR